MKTTALYGHIILLLLAAACSPVPTTAPSTTDALVPSRPTTLHIEMPEDADIADIPHHMAIDSLRAQGYTVETLSLANTSLSLLALEKGNLDVAGVNNSHTWSAIKQGASIITIMDQAANTKLVVTAEDIEECADLNGKGVGVNSMKSTSTVLLIRYLERECPGVKPEYLIIEGSHNRWAALLAGHLDAAAVDLSDMIQFAVERQSDLNMLLVYSQEYPGLRTTGTVIRRDLANEFPETVKDIIRAILLARRAIQDPQVLSAEMVKRLQMDPEAAQTAAELYLEREIWDVNGGYTMESVQANIDFLVETAVLSPGLKPDDVADLSYLNAVLDEIGRQ